MSVVTSFPIAYHTNFAHSVDSTHARVSAGGMTNDIYQKKQGPNTRRK